MKQHRFKILAGAAAVIALFWFLMPGGDIANTEIVVEPRQGEFVVSVTTTGELRSTSSQKVVGPTSARETGVWDLKIARLIPEGTIVGKGDFVAELDRSALDGKIQEAVLAVQKAESQFVQAKLDSTLTLSNARDELINLRYAMEERKLAVEQAAYEAPSVKRQSEIEYDRSVRNYDQAVKNYDTKVKQAEAKISEVQADLIKQQQRMDLYNKVIGEFIITAPDSGMFVYERSWNGQKVVVGSSVSAWEPVVGVLPNFENMESITYVNEVDIQKIKSGQRAILSLDASSDKMLNGVVTSVANIGESRPNSDSKVFEVLINVTDRDTTLRPSMTTSNQIIASHLENALALPLETIHAKDSLNYVFKKSGGSIVRQQVIVGLLNENEAEIQRGVQLGDQIYLSLPADTTGLRWVRLDAEVASNPASGN